MHTCMPGLAVQNYATYPSMPGALPSIMPGQTWRDTGHKGPYARCHLGRHCRRCPRQAADARHAAGQRHSTGAVMHGRRGGR